MAEALTGRLGRGEITLARYDLIIKPVDERIASLQAERNAVPDPSPVLGEQQTPGASRAQWRQRWDTADHKGKRDLLTMALRGKHLVIQPAQRCRGSSDPIRKRKGHGATGHHTSEHVRKAIRCPRPAP